MGTSLHPSPDPTAALATMALQALIGVALALYARSQRCQPGFLPWSASFGFAALGFLVLSLRSLGFESIEVTVTGFLLSSLFLDLDGTVRFMDGRRLAPGWHLVPWATTALQLALPPEVFTARLWLFSLPAAAVLGTTGFLLLRRAPWGRPGLHRTVALCRFLAAAVLLGHSATWDFLPPPNEFQARALGIGTLLAFCATSLFQMAGYLWLSAQRSAHELRESRESLRQTLADLTTQEAELEVLGGLLHLCPKCQRIQDPDGGWYRLESYVQARSEAKFSHGLCPVCIGVLYPEAADLEAPGS